MDKFGYYAKLEKVTIHGIDILSLSKFMCQQDQKSCWHMNLEAGSGCGREKTSVDTLKLSSLSQF